MEFREIVPFSKNKVNFAYIIFFSSLFTILKKVPIFEKRLRFVLQCAVSGVIPLEAVTMQSLTPRVFHRPRIENPQVSKDSSQLSLRGIFVGKRLYLASSTVMKIKKISYFLFLMKRQCGNLKKIYHANFM